MLTAVIIAKNEEKIIGECLMSLQFADEILVINNNSTDNTEGISKKLKARVINFSGVGYDLARNIALKESKYDWLFYLDADERVSPELKNKIISITKNKTSAFSAFEVNRRNIYLGKQMRYGGWGEDFIIRLFKKSHLFGWVNHLHEQPKFKGKLGKISESIIHYSHRDLYSMTEKTIFFTNFEAENRLAANHPAVVWWRFIRVMWSEFYLRFIRLSAWRDGAEGIIDGVFQVFNSFVIYSRLWELQNDKKSANL